MLENVGLFLLGAAWGAVLTFEFCFKRFLSFRDPLGECVREQSRKVAFLSRFADDNYAARSTAVVRTIDGEFEVQVIRKGR